MKDLENTKDFRLISLCNVVIKLITKTMANRLKTILLDIIYKNQNAFIPGRLITNNTLVAFEIFHHMRKKSKGKKRFFTLKLDMSEAYDRVELPFLIGMMNKMDFLEN